MNKYALIETTRKVRDSLANSLGGTNGARVAANSILAGSAAFTVAALARVISQQKEQDHKYADIDSSKYLDMSVQDPIVSKEHVDELTGRQKQAAFNTKDMVRWSAPAAAALFAGTLGHTIVDRAYDRSNEEKLKEEEAILADLTKKVSLARALNARNQLSDDAYNELMTQIQPYMGKTASDNPIVMPALGLVMSLAFALSAYGAYHHDAARNPARLKYKAIKGGLKNFAMQNGGMYPIDRPLTEDEETKEALRDLDSKSPAASPTETPMTIAPVTI